MPLSNELKQYVIQELRTVAEKLSNADLADCVFYYSAAYAAIQRTFNIKFEPSLMLLYVVLAHSFNEINARVRTPANETGPVFVGPSHFSQIAEALEKIASKFESGESYLEELEKIAAVGYSSQGNGFYLWETGRITTIESLEFPGRSGI